MNKISEDLLFLRFLYLAYSYRLGVDELINFRAGQAIPLSDFHVLG